MPSHFCFQNQPTSIMSAIPLNRLKNAYESITLSIQDSLGNLMIGPQCTQKNIQQKNLLTKESAKLKTGKAGEELKNLLQVQSIPLEAGWSGVRTPQLP